MKIAVTGHSGQLVTALKRLGPEHGVEIIAIGRPELDLADLASIGPALTAARPDAIISAAAYTAVDKAESEPDLAMQVNGAAAGEIARVAAGLNVPVVHVSTDYVFDGSATGFYRESDPTAPLGVYGATKLEGERQVAAATPNHAILRTAWVYSPFGANFVKTMLRLGETRDALRVVGDQRGRPTSALDLAVASIQVAQRLQRDGAPALRGVFHASAGGEATWAEFAEAIFAGAALRGRSAVAVEAITTAEYPTPARRPANSRLSGDKLQIVHGIALPDWRVSLDQCLTELLGAPH
jgi:dTDP-4-dehydrorhamnose reductase